MTGMGVMSSKQKSIDCIYIIIYELYHSLFDE